LKVRKILSYDDRKTRGVCKARDIRANPRRQYDGA
jgi:hypothetical protein